jgi:hypothetical protein
MKKAKCTVRAGKRSPQIKLTENQCSTLRPGKLLGCGRYGCAYVSNALPGMVVKFTRDDMDAAGLLKLKNHPDVVPVDSVFHLKSRLKDPVFAAIVKRADPLTEEEQFLIDTVFRPAAGRALYAEISRSQGRPAIFPMSGGIQNIKKLCKILSEKSAQVNRKKCLSVSLRAAKIVQDLAKKGLRFSDSHSGNFGKVNGKIVATDLGLTLAEFDQEPEVLSGLFGFLKKR